MNSSRISKENETFTITANSLLSKNRVKPRTNINFLSVATHTNTFHSYKKFQKTDNLKYRKTISYSKSSSIVDLMEQSNLSEKRKIPINKNYFINYIKMKLKNNKTKLPTIQTIKSFSQNTDYNLRTFSIDINNLSNYNSFHKTFNYETRKSNKEKINELYKKIYENKSNLKRVYVNHFINNNKKTKEKKESLNVKIKPKLLNNINQNFITSEKKFMKYHGFNKRKKFNYNLNSLNKIRDKYPNMDNIKILQFFLKKKLKIINKDMDVVKNECEIAKNDLVSVYDFFNAQVQKGIDEVYGNGD